MFYLIGRKHLPSPVGRIENVGRLSFIGSSLGKISPENLVKKMLSFGGYVGGNVKRKLKYT